MVVREFEKQTDVETRRRQRDIEPKALVHRAGHQLRGAHEETEPTRARREEHFDIAAWFALEGVGAQQCIAECWYG